MCIEPWAGVKKTWFRIYNYKHPLTDGIFNVNNCWWQNTDGFRYSTETESKYSQFAKSNFYMYNLPYMKVSVSAMLQVKPTWHISNTF